jgi:MFS family permease
LVYIPRFPHAHSAHHFPGRRPTIIAGCFIYIIGVILQACHTHGLGLIVSGRLIAGIGVGFVSAVIILYSESFTSKISLLKLIIDFFS